MLAGYTSTHKPGPPYICYMPPILYGRMFPGRSASIEITDKKRDRRSTDSEDKSGLVAGEDLAIYFSMIPGTGMVPTSLRLRWTTVLRSVGRRPSRHLRPISLERIAETFNTALDGDAREALPHGPPAKNICALLHQGRAPGVCIVTRADHHGSPGTRWP